MAFGVSGYVGLKTQSLIRVLYLPRADIAGYGFLFVKDPATSRTQSTNSCAAADPPTASMGSADASTSQLVQAMAGFGGGSGGADGLNAVPLGADTPQQTFLGTPQHA